MLQNRLANIVHLNQARISPNHVALYQDRLTLMLLNNFVPKLDTHFYLFYLTKLFSVKLSISKFYVSTLNVYFLLTKLVHKVFYRCQIEIGQHYYRNYRIFNMPDATIPPPSSRLKLLEQLVLCATVLYFIWLKSISSSRH